MNLTDWLNQSDYHFFFLSVDKFLNIRLPQLKNFHNISDYSQKNSGQLLAASIPHIKKISPPQKSLIISFKPSAKIDHLCRQHQFLKASPAASLCRQLENKLKFARLLKTNHLPQPPFTIASLSSLSQFTPPLVIQTAHGWAGKNSYLIKDKTPPDLPPATTVKFSPFLPNSYTLTNNCCLTSSGLLQSPPALQITGLSPYTQNPLATVGRQWPAPIPAKIKTQVKNITQKFSQILVKLKFKGFFGLDFLVHQDRVLLQECNPRLTASFAFYTKLEQKKQLNPLFLFHLLEFLPIHYPFNLKQEQHRFSASLTGHQLTYKNKLGQTIKQINKFSPFTSTPLPQ